MIAFVIYMVLPIILLLVNKKFFGINPKYPLAFSGIAFLILTVSFYFVNQYDAWYVESRFDFRPLNISIEELLFGFFYPLSVVTIYDFVCRQKRVANTGFRKLFLVSLILLGIMITAILISLSALFKLPYSYLIISTIYMLPVLVFCRRFFSQKLLIAALVNFVISLVFEIFSLVEGWWVFRGEYLFSLNVYGFVLPFEEIFFWIILGSVWVCLLYDYSFRKKGLSASF